MSKTSDNNIIAEFMQWGNCYPASDWDTFGRLPGSLLFDVSWDWLMLVVDKIHSMDEYITYETENGGYGVVLSTDISKVYESVLSFINWYNEKYI